VIERTEGAEGLAELARVSKRANDLRAWCHALTAANDWEAAFAAYKEAADTVTSNAFARAGFLDGVALAAQMLERNDLHQHLERAWREVPTLLRLRRWLGSAKSGAVLRKRAQQALEACPKKTVRQLALLHVVLGDLKSAAAFLADAPGLGWSDTEHPGHLLFPLFQQLLGGVEQPIPGEFEFVSSGEWDVDQLDWMADEQDEPQLDTPGVNEILQLGSIDNAVTGEVRTTMLNAMRKAAEKRVAGVIENKRRRHYGHAAQLVGICASLDVAGEKASWATAIRNAYRRYPAFQRELASCLGHAL